MLDTRSSGVKVADVYRYFGTFSRSMISMLEITVGNPLPGCPSLLENVGESLASSGMLFYLLNNGDEELTVQEFSAGISRLKGTARSSTLPP